MADATRYRGDVGRRVGTLTFLGLAAGRKDGGRFVGRFRCDCGSERSYPAGRVLRNGSRTHCGCQANRSPNLQHGMRGSAEYRSWGAMKGRCLNPRHKDYPRWGGAGVTLCAEWAASFEAFYAHMGARPPGTTLDRINNTRGYEPGNCRWATGAEQQTNRRSSYTVEINGVQYPSMEAAGHAHGVSAMTIIRWCDGYCDARRAHTESGGVIAAKPGCRRWRTYAR